VFATHNIIIYDDLSFLGECDCWSFVTIFLTGFVVWILCVYGTFCVTSDV
jgi:hypothetical protein